VPARQGNQEGEMRRTGWLAGIALLGWLGVAATPAWADGAVARGPEGRVGLSYNYRNQRAAEERALEECGRYCRIVGSFRHSCAAIAVGARGGYGWARAERRGRAEGEAMEYCRHEGNQGCRIVTSACDERG
jgi:hypothetical protein